MGGAGLPRVYLRACGEAEDVRAPLGQAGHAVVCPSPEADEPPDPSEYGLVVLDAGLALPEALAFCRRLRERPADAALPILIVLNEHAADARAACFAHGADTYVLRPFRPEELLAQVSRLLRPRELHRRVEEKAAEVRRLAGRLHHAHRQHQQEARLVQALRRVSQPRTLPSLPSVRFAVRTAPHGQAGGDFFDARRLDEDHVGLFLADALGRGTATDLLALLVRQALRVQESQEDHGRPLPPGQVLQQLNRELLGQDMPEEIFLSMVYFLIDGRAGTVHYARAGHPPPLYVPCGGAPRLWPAEGSFLGVFDTTFPVQTHQLRPGDKVVLYSDGLTGTAGDDQDAGPRALLEAASRYRDLPLEPFLEHLHRDLRVLAGPAEDGTLLGLEALADLGREASAVIN